VAVMVKNKTTYIMYACWAIAILNIALNALLIPLFGISGAAAATGFSYLLFALSYALISRHLWPIAYPLKLIAALLAVPLAAVTVIALIAWFGPGVAVNLVLKLVVLTLTALLLAVLVGRAERINLKELFGLARRMIRIKKKTRVV